MCNFVPVQTPGAPRRTLSKIMFLSMCPIGLFIVLFCRIHGLDFVQSRRPGAPERGHSLKSPLPVVRNWKQLFLYKPNALEWSKRMYKEVFLLSMPFRSHHFDAFLPFLSFWVILYNGLNKFLRLILRSNWTCRMSFGILSLSPFCIVMSDFAYLLPFSNNFPLKNSKDIHKLDNSWSHN